MTTRANGSPPPDDRDADAPDPAATFTAMVEALDRGDRLAATERKHELHRQGWSVIPKPTWGRGGRS